MVADRERESMPKKKEIFIPRLPSPQIIFSINDAALLSWIGHGAKNNIIEQSN